MYCTVHLPYPTDTTSHRPILGIIIGNCKMSRAAKLGTVAACVVLLLIQEAAASPYECCPGEGVISYMLCPNGSKTKASDLCDRANAFVLQKDFDEDKYVIDTKSDQLILSSGAIPKERYCLGKMDILNEVRDIAIICFNVEEVDDSRTIGVLATAICCLTSTVFLVATLVVYAVLPELRDLQGKCLMSSVLSLFMAFVLLATVQLYNNFNRAACLTMASLLYFWFLCVFFWLNVVSFNVWQSVVRPKWLPNKRHLLYMYNAWGWGVPLLMLAIALICQHAPGNHITPGFGHGSCWFASSKRIWLYFYGPISVLLLANLGMFVWTAWTLWKDNTSYRSENKLRSQKFKFLLYLKLFFVMGICWTFEPISMALIHPLWVVTDYINALQGILIFLLLVVFRKRVRRAIARRGFCCVHFSNSWAAMRDEDCEELEESEDSSANNNQQQTDNVTFNELQK